jgi:hypothetical protein
VWVKYPLLYVFPLFATPGISRITETGQCRDEAGVRQLTICATTPIPCLITVGNVVVHGIASQ